MPPSNLPFDAGRAPGFRGESDRGRSRRGPRWCGATAAVAAMLEGYRFIGLEKDAEYLAIARARITHACK